MLKIKPSFLVVLSCSLLYIILKATPVFAESIIYDTTRLAGSDRYTTSVAVSKAGWTQADVIIIATGSDYPDALSASALAKSQNAPILLTEKNLLKSVTLDEIKRLKATKAILIGGTGAIGTGVENQLKGLRINITRIGGVNRYDTSKKIAEKLGVSNGIIVATGSDFPDALSIAPIAGIKSIPILLSPKTSLDPIITAFIKGKSIPVSYIVGGTGVLGTGVASSVPNSKRLGGDNRYLTNQIISRQFAGDLNFDTVCLATGKNFPDALSGSALAAKNCSPIFLTDNVSSDVIGSIIKNNIKNVSILGGTGAVGKSVENLGKELKSKGGIIGTADKGVVALRFDDYQNTFREKIYPLLTARGLPCSMSLISRFNTEQSWGIGTTWDEVRNWNRNGLEIWSHGTDHKDYSSKGYAGLYSQIVTSKSEIEAQDIKVVGWTLPGVAPSTSNLPYNGLTKPSDYNSTVGMLLMDTYALTEAYAYTPQRILPSYIYHGLNHITVSDGSETVASSEEAINKAINNKSGIELMCHSGNLGKPGNMTFAEFQTLLDYIKTQWDNGSVEVLTPSGLCFANPNSSNRLKLNTDDSFEGLTVSSPGAWSETKNWDEKTIETSGGRTGSNFLRINSSAADSGVTQKIMGLDRLGVSGEQFVFEGWFRSNSDRDTTGVVQIDDYDNSDKLKIISKSISKGSFWTRVRFVFCIPPSTKNITLSLYGSSGAGIDWDDVSIKII